MNPRSLLRAGVLSSGLWAVGLSASAEPPPPLRFFPAAAFEGQGDSIQSGVRVSRALDGSVRVAQERFDAGGVARGVPVPPSLGGGFVFFQPLGSTGGAAGTGLFRAATWTGEMSPLATVPFVVSDLRVGFDRFYLLGSGRAIALDPDTGTYLPLDPLPKVATLLELGFDSEGRARLRAPILGAVETADAGLSWQRLGEEDGLATVSPEDELGLEAGLPRQGRLLQELVVRAGALPGGSVVGLVAGERVTFDPDRGVLVRSLEPQLDPRADCRALSPGRLGEPRDPSAASLLWFACRAPGAELELRGYQWAETSGASPAPELSMLRREVFPGQVRVLAAGRLGVLLDVPCAGPQAAKRRLCLLGRSGKLAIEAPPGETRGLETFAVGGASVHRISLGPDGGIVSERLGAPGRPSVYRIHHETEIEGLVFGGTWLPGATVFEEGISFWATRGESYVGVRLERDGTSARVGAIQRPLRRASISGSHALAWGASGFARVSRDGGMTFAEIDYPFVSGDQDPNGIVSADQALELGCGPAGCSLGTWVSVGWGELGHAASVLAAPPRVPIPPLGGGRFRFTCSAVGEISAPSLPSQERSGRADESSPGPDSLSPFWDRPAPRPGPLEVAYSVGDHRGLARIYALGPKEGAWGSRGRVMVAFRSPFNAKQNSESLWSADLLSDGAEAQTLLGTTDRTTQTAYTELDPGGEGGVILVRTRQETTLLSFGHKAHVRRYAVPESFGLGTLAGAVFSRERWLIGSVAGRLFRIIELGESGLEELASFPLGETGPREALLTRSTAGDLGIAIDGDLGLLVYPVSKRGELGDALFQTFRGSRPPQCSAEAAGYLVVRELGIAPYVEGSDGELDVSRVTMRRVVGFGPECIDALAADARGELDPALARPGRAEPGSTPLVITDRTDSGRRVRLSCQ